MMENRERLNFMRNLLIKPVQRICKYNCFLFLFSFSFLFFFENGNFLKFASTIFLVL